MVITFWDIGGGGGSEAASVGNLKPVPRRFRMTWPGAETPGGVIATGPASGTVEAAFAGEPNQLDNPRRMRENNPARLPPLVSTKPLVSCPSAASSDRAGRLGELASEMTSGTLNG